MAVNKVVKIDGSVIIDLSTDTVTSSSHIMAPYTGHLADGTQVTGSLVVNKYYTGSSEPSSSLGNDGDIYLKVVS